MLSNKDKQFLARAIELARQSECRFRLGAFLTRNSSILGWGSNTVTNDPFYVPFQSCSRHAEAAALKRAKNPIRGTMYVARVDRKNVPTMAKPCCFCVPMLRSAGIERVVWTGNDGPYAARIHEL